MGFVALLIVAMLAGIAVAILLRRERTRGLLRSTAAAPPDPVGPTAGVPRGILGTWLLRAGYGAPGAPGLFLIASAAAVASGAVLGGLSSAVLGSVAATVGEIPGGVGEMLVSVIGIGPYGVALAVALAPTLVVRARRRTRVSSVEHDLPLVLELLATSAQAGLGLDAALARVVEAQPARRPLTTELRAFQRDLLGGSPRLHALRQLAWRVDVTSLSVFIAAVIQSEQVGSSMADTLRTQADDLRARRREQALLLAQALPVKLVFPLLICFLPGIFLSTLGPVLYQMIRVADAVYPSDHAWFDAHTAMTRPAAALLSLCLLTTACAARSASRLDSCHDADGALARLLEALDTARAAGCSERAPYGSCVARERDLDTLLLQCPAHVPTRLAVAVLAFDGGQRLKAQQLLDDVLTPSAALPDAAVLRARLAIDDGNLPFARRLLADQVTLSPTHAAVRETLASALYLLGQWDEARDQLAAARRFGAPGWRVAYHLGLVEEGAGRPDAAVAHYREALEQKPELAEAKARLDALAFEHRLESPPLAR